MAKNKEWLRWLVWIIFFGILFGMGQVMFQIRHMHQFVIIIVVLPFLLLIAFRLLREKGE